MKPDEPREFRKGFGWPVDLARDAQANCQGCGAPIYWIKIRTKAGVVKPMPMSEALAKRDGEQVYLSGHHADCPAAERFGGKQW